jgi:hypothetical protein
MFAQCTYCHRAPVHNTPGVFPTRRIPVRQSGSRL